MVSWIWIPVVAFISFLLGLFLFAILSISQLCSDAEAAHDETGDGEYVQGRQVIPGEVQTRIRSSWDEAAGLACKVEHYR